MFALLFDLYTYGDILVVHHAFAILDFDQVLVAADELGQHELITDNLARHSTLFVSKLVFTYPGEIIDQRVNFLLNILFNM